MDAPVRGRRGRPRRVLPEAASVAPEAVTEETVAAAAPVRPALRAPVRDEDPREAARKRAAEIMQHLGGLDEGVDEFYVDPSKVPDGWTYEWKRKTIMNQEDPAYQVHLARGGWEPVPLDRHREMMPAGGSWNTIERKGMQLMQRPKEITEQFRNIEKKKARDQVKHKEQQLSAAPDGQFTRDHAQVKPRINKGYEPMPIPED